MANEVFFDTSGFFTLMDERDELHQKGWNGCTRVKDARAQ